MLVLKDDLSIELFDIEKLERSITVAIENALDGAIGHGCGDTYRPSHAERVTANVTYLILKTGCACTEAEIRCFTSKDLNADERAHYDQNH